MADLNLDSIDPPKQLPLWRGGYDRFFAVAGLFAAVTIQLAGQANGSCGDYLQHASADSFKLHAVYEETPISVPAEVPSRCRHGNCRGPLPVHLPTHDKDRFRRDDRTSAMHIAFDEDVLTAHSQFGLAVDENLPSQAVLEVSVPPPRS